MNNQCYYCGNELGTGDFVSPLTIPICASCNRTQLQSNISTTLTIPKPFTVHVSDGNRDVKVDLEKLIDFLIEHNLTVKE